MKSSFTIDRSLLVKGFFFVTLAFFVYQLFLLASPFFTSLLSAIMLVITFHPLQVRVHRWVKRPNLSASLLTAAVVLSAILPLIGVFWVVISEADNLIPTAQHLLSQINSGEFLNIRSRLPDLFLPLFDKIMNFFNNVSVDPKQFFLENVQEIGAHLAALGSWFARNAIFMFFQFLITVISVFFLFRDGPSLLKWVLNLIPLEKKDKEDMAHSAYQTFRAVTSGVFVTAIAQGILAMIGFYIGQVKLPFLLGVATGLVSLLGAAALVTMPVALFMFTVSTWQGVFLLIWGGLVVGLVDNFLKPILIGSRARLPFVLVFFSILGGLKMYGILGIVLGPMMMGVALTFIRIYKEKYSDDRSA
jgi:predicted PurR-regulated permease PerM